MHKLRQQLIVLVSLVLAFLLLNFSIYYLFTYRCISDNSAEKQAKSITLDAYLPFDENSGIVKHKATLTLSGELPVLDGAAALYPVFSAYAYALYPEESVVFDGTDFSKDSALQMNNTRGAYKAIVDGETDIAVCVAPSEEQLAYAKEQGVELSFVPIGKEAFVFLVNKQNPVDSLTTEQVRGIYAGKYTYWDEVGGNRKPIGALYRNAGSGSQSAMLSYMDGTPIKDNPFTYFGSCIGFSFRYYVEGLVKNGDVKMIALDGVYPNVENIKNGSYPIIAQIYAVYRSDNKNENVQKVVDWMLSKEGQAIMEATGYVGIE